MTFESEGMMIEHSRLSNTDPYMATEFIPEGWEHFGSDRLSAARMKKRRR
jgi:hypothetical protein